MTDATEEMRRMLDERGVEWENDCHGMPWWKVGDSRAYLYALGVGLGHAVVMFPVTPQQAIDATLGRGECQLTQIDKDCDTASEYMLDRWCVFDEVYRCSCGATFGHSAKDRPRFCPNCGARVVEVTVDE